MSTYRIASYGDGQPRAAIIVGDRVYDAAELTGSPAYRSVMAIIEDWEAAAPLLSDVAMRATGGKSIADVELLAPLLYPSTIYCAGANYQDHMDAVTAHRGLPPQPSPREIGVGPFFFLKSPRTIVASGSEIAIWSEMADFEVELAAIVGKRARNVKAGDAHSIVAGYCIANDLSDRARVMRTQLPVTSPFRMDWYSHKNFDGACPMGPWIVPASDIPDPQSLRMRTWINGKPRQDSSTGKMVFSLAEQIEALTAFQTLYPGDVILTGTPAGVGAESDTWLQQGDVIRMEIDGIGEITNRIV